VRFPQARLLGSWGLAARVHRLQPACAPAVSIVRLQIDTALSLTGVRLLSVLAARVSRVLLPVAARKNGPSASELTLPASVGVRRSPVSRLFVNRVCRSPSAYSLPTPSGTATGPFLLLSPIARLLGRGDTTHSRRSR